MISNIQALDHGYQFINNQLSQIILFSVLIVLLKRLKAPKPIVDLWKKWNIIKKDWRIWCL